MKRPSPPGILAGTGGEAGGDGEERSPGVMEIPRSGYWGLALFWALVPGLSGPSARADERERRATPPNHHAIARHPSTVVHPVDEIEEDQPPGELSAEQRARVILACTMVLSEGYMTPPPDYPGALLGA